MLNHLLEEFFELIVIVAQHFNLFPRRWPLLSPSQAGYTYSELLMQLLSTPLHLVNHSKGKITNCDFPRPTLICPPCNRYRLRRLRTPQVILPIVASTLKFDVVALARDFTEDCLARTPVWKTRPRTRRSSTSILCTPLRDWVRGRMGVSLCATRKNSRQAGTHESIRGDPIPTDYPINSAHFKFWK